MDTNMKKLYPLLSVLFLIYWGCEEEQEVDTTPPTVTISYPLTNSTVSEMVTINCISSDNEGVEKVELWVNGVSTGVTDNTEPYSFDWNTTLADNGSYSITVRSYDTNENTTDSEPIVLTVDNTQSNPQPINITSVVFDNGGFTITWNQSTDGDFSSYELEKSVESTMGNYDAVYTSSDVTSTSYVDTDVDPLVYQYYRIAVTDTFDYETKGEIVSSSLDPVPSSVNVTSVTYTMDEMTVEWEESSDGDFRDYKLVYSETDSVDRDTLVTYTDKSTISHTITEFDPTHENWYWIEVSDTLGQTSIGSGMTNEIDSAPIPVDIVEVNYTNQILLLKWNSNTENDFHSYEVQQSDDETFTTYSVLIVNSDVFDTTLTIEFPTLIDERYYFRVRVDDKWGLQSYSENDFLSTYEKVAYNIGNGSGSEVHLIDYDGFNDQTIAIDISYTLKWSFDNRLIFFYSSQSIWSIDIATGNIVEYQDLNIPYSTLAYELSPSSPLIVYDDGNDAFIYNYETDELTNIGDFNRFSFSRDGEQLLAYSFSNYNTYIYNINEHSSELVLENSQWAEAKFNYNAEKIGFTLPIEKSAILDLNTGVIDTLDLGNANFITFMPNSNQFIVYKDEGGSRHYMINEDLTISSSFPITNPMFNVSVKNDGTKIAIGKDGAVYTIDAQTMEAFQVTNQYLQLISFAFQR
jgi:hypothetical protein